MEKTLRVLHVVVNMNRGGAETLLMNLFRNIDRTKVQFDFLTCKEGVFDEEIKALGGKIHRIPYITDLGHFGYIKALEQFFSTNKNYKIVHSHMDKMSGIVLRAAQKYKIPVRIAHSHNTNSEGSLPAKIYKWYAGRNILSSATHYFACSTAAGKWLYGDKANNVRILKNGIECDQFKFIPEIRKQVREELQLEEASFVIGHVGRFNQQKNHAFLIETFAKLIHDIPNATLLLAGDGPLRLEIEKKIKDLNIEGNVKLLGIRSDIHRLFQAIDLFVFPSFHEGLPVTLIEAQGAGVPCVISDVITKEVDMGLELVNYLPLDDQSKWISTIKSVATKNNLRINSTTYLSKKGYDIKNTAEWSQGFYLAL
ncbi:glycosyltransferase family 1 protein [Alkalihalobacillus sp. BA299]|uniref:glycosyltransferase family 1 protein n=1 Tax=Alkalihalobacillus sp. BA299 TaxID=2815938 RepID=UPI001ADC691F|nr:glycosyltransferase family 1 protein [Alkalihalobacillus sp. BA299]